MNQCFFKCLFHFGIGDVLGVPFLGVVEGLGSLLPAAPVETLPGVNVGFLGLPGTVLVCTWCVW